jgi:hypothetical protein
MLDERAEAQRAPAVARAPAAPLAPAHADAGAAVTEPPAYVTERRVAGRGGAMLIDELGEEPRPLASSEEEGERPRAARERPIASAAGGEREPSRTGAQPDPGALPGSWQSSPESPAAVPPHPRTTPRARPWDTPLGDEPTLRVRRGRDARIDNGG